jgi:hypothetical protein
MHTHNQPLVHCTASSTRAQTHTDKDTDIQTPHTSTHTCHTDHAGIMCAAALNAHNHPSAVTPNHVTDNLAPARRRTCAAATTAAAAP